MVLQFLKLAKNLPPELNAGKKIEAGKTPPRPSKNISQPAACSFKAELSKTFFLFRRENRSRAKSKM